MPCRPRIGIMTTVPSGEKTVYIDSASIPWLGIAVTEDEALALKRPSQLGPDQMPHGAVGAVGGDHP